jgi:hypothetical protein
MVQECEPFFSAVKSFTILHYIGLRYSRKVFNK